MFRIHQNSSNNYFRISNEFRQKSDIAFLISDRICQVSDPTEYEWYGRSPIVSFNPYLSLCETACGSPGSPGRLSYLLSRLISYAKSAGNFFLFAPTARSRRVVFETPMTRGFLWRYCRERARRSFRLISWSKSGVNLGAAQVLWAEARQVR